MAGGDALQSVRELFAQLRRRGFDLGPDDLDALRRALQAGFGWDSRRSLRELLVALWAKTAREAQALRALFERLPWPDGWTAQAAAPSPRLGAGPRVATDPRPVVEPNDAAAAKPSPPLEPCPDDAPQLQRVDAGLPPWPTQGLRFAGERLIDVEMFPLSHREVAQAFRRLRRPARFGPATEFDLGSTVAARLRSGVVSPPVMVPRRRNAARLLMLVDVHGSMQPYAPFVEMVCEAVLQAGLLNLAQRLYFHDVPGAGADRALLDELPVGGFAPVLDPLLARIEPAARGEVYLDPALEQPVDLPALLQSLQPGTAMLIVGDAGAARGRFDLAELFDLVAFAKALRLQSLPLAWLNPLPRGLWARSTAAQLARHLPMFPLDRGGVLQAMNALRGQPVGLERPL